MANIKDIVQNQRDFFSTHQTLDIAFRKSQLKLLQDSIIKNEDKILDALKQDLNKPNFEAYETELGIVYEELSYALKNIDKWTKPSHRKTPLMHFHAVSRIQYDPFGCVLIMSPWNYPFQLAFIPLIGAIAAGNCVTVKPSNYSAATSRVIKEILSVFPAEYISVVEGGRAANTELLDQKFDFIFFTGSPRVGKLVMEKASSHLTPVILELGGKSPCIVDENYNIDLAAKRIAWGKCLNSGQTCVAPDYILVHKSVKTQFISSLIKHINKFYGTDPENNKEYPKIINEQHFNRLVNLIENAGEVIGGKYNAETHQIAPAIIDNCTWDSKVMQEEIFGPIFPVIEFDNIKDIAKQINSRPKPLALYLFTNSKAAENYITNHVFYGGGCINDTIVHLANINLPFGGVGNSGMGNYHGKKSFEAFSHSKSILKKCSWIDVPFRYAPYKNKIKLLRLIMRKK